MRAPAARTHAALAVVVLAALLAPQALGAGGETIGITPPEIDLAAAQRGEVYHRSFMVQNRFNASTVVTLEPAGALASWVVTEPTSGFTVPPNTNKIVKVLLSVPANATNGTYTGLLRAIADPKSSPDGTGFSVRFAATVRLNLSVGGNATPKVHLADAAAKDVEAGTPPFVTTRIGNEGNVRSEVKVVAEIFDKNGKSMGLRTLNVALAPGQYLDLPLEFGESLPQGTYDVHIRTSADGVAENLEIREFRVVAPGGLAKTGTIRFLQHEPWVKAGKPVRVVAVFENTGDSTIARAQFFGEALIGAEVVAVFTSPALLVPSKGLTNLTAFFTPQDSGTYTLRGRVVFDGLESRDTESVLNVLPADASLLDGAIDLVKENPVATASAVTATGGAGWFLFFFWRRRKAKAPEPPQAHPEPFPDPPWTDDPNRP